MRSEGIENEQPSIGELRLGLLFALMPGDTQQEAYASLRKLRDKRHTWFGEENDLRRAIDSILGKDAP